MQQIQSKLNFKSNSFLINHIIKTIGIKSITTNIANYQLFQKITQSIRIERNILKIPANKKIKLVFFNRSEFLNDYIDIIKYFVKCDSHIFLNNEKNLDNNLKIFSSGNIRYSIDYDIDVDAVRKDKDKKLVTLHKRKNNLESKLNNQNFIKKAPKDVVAATIKELKNVQEEILEINKA